MRHRSDVDGLRALAVVPVVLYHLGFSTFRGGFVGVDVFFVISGYLITGLLEQDLSEGGLKVAEFYDRRIRRIFPALFTVHVVSLVAAAIFLFPAEAKDAGRDVLASLAFVSNIVFCRTTNYFDQSVQSSLLLHTWSLSVEEQFYLGFPLVLLALRRVPRGVKLAVLSGLGVASFALSEQMLRVASPRAFYLVHYRAWELLLGAVLSVSRRKAERRDVAEVTSALGVGLILWTVFTLRESYDFPGRHALAPCLGAALVLYSGAGSVRSFTARVLGAEPLRLVGLVSYSLYLWHWPLIGLYEHRAGRLPLLARLVVLALSAVLSALSYRYVETPFRRRAEPRNPRRTLGVAAVAMGAVATLAVVLPIAADRLNPPGRAWQTLAYTRYHAATKTRAGICFMTTGFDAPDAFRRDVCLPLRPDGRNFLVMGDSHAAHVWMGLHDVRPDLNIMQATASGCHLALLSQGEPRCTRLFDYILGDFLPKHRVHALFIATRWVTADAAELAKLIAYARPFADRIGVFGPIVEYDDALPRILAWSILDRDPAVPSRHEVTARRAIDVLLSETVRAAGADYYSLYDAACPKEGCFVWATPVVPVQYDYGHMTAEGAALIIERLGPSLFR